jgi:ribulose kinase
MTGTMCGVNFDHDLNNLALFYLSCIQSLAYQCKHIISLMKSNGMVFKIINIIGGLATNKLYSQLQSDICELPVYINDKSDTIVTLGSAILGKNET